MKKINKILLILGLLAFININIIALCLVFFPENDIANIMAIGNGMLLVLNGLMFGVAIGFKMKFANYTEGEKDGS